MPLQGTTVVLRNMAALQVAETQPDFQQPPFYQEYFKKWGLEAPKQRK
jgi:hypothetical protein